MPGTGDELSILGFGCMRFKRNLAATDIEKATQQVRRAIDLGVNYFDTAYLYPGNEKALGTILNKSDNNGNRLRDRVFVATKLPVMAIREPKDMDRMLDTSLDRLNMEYIDYYLAHNLSNMEGWENLKKLGIIEFFEKAIANGKIKHIGFSWHGNLHDFRKVIDDYPWEFCQIQYNYLDEHYQAGTEGMKYAAKRGVGVIVMEPLRGGMIVGKMPKNAANLIDNYSDAYGVKHTAADWALRWIWNHPEITCVLSGMNDISQVEENCAAAMNASPGALSDDDLAMIDGVRAVFMDSIKVNCTGCAYCMPCPYGVDIPFCFSSRNSYAMFGGISQKIMYNFAVRPIGGKPSAKASMCRKCGACEQKCPQHLPIMESLSEAAKTLEGPFYKAAIALYTKFIGR